MGGRPPRTAQAVGLSPQGSGIASVRESNSFSISLSSGSRFAISQARMSRSSSLVIHRLYNIPAERSAAYAPRVALEVPQILSCLSSLVLPVVLSKEYAINKYEMAYELFDNKSARIGSPALTVHSQGSISLNADAGDIVASLGAKYAQILWDRETLKLAIRPLAKRDAQAFKLTFLKGKRGVNLSARSFLNYIQWRLSGAFSAPVHWNEKEGLLEAVLPRERVGPVGSKSRK